MNVEQQLMERSSGKCELTGTTGNLQVYAVFPKTDKDAEGCIYISESCVMQLDKKVEADALLKNALKDSIWSPVNAVQVTAWRMLNRLSNETWAIDLLDMVYLDADLLEWAQATGDHIEINENEIYKDSNGAILQQGDSVVLIKTLDVKGSSVSARVGTVVKNIKLVSGNNEQVEGRIDGQQIVILTKYLKRQ